MNKADLKQRWSKYTDTDKLVDDIIKLLRECNFRQSEHGVCTMLDTYFTNKEPLIKLLQKSKNYAGDMRVISIQEFERENSSVNINSAVYWLPRETKAETIIKKKKDKFGKTLADYLCTGVKHIQAIELEDKSLAKKFAKVGENVNAFNYEGYTNESCKRWSKFNNIMYAFQEIYVPNLEERHVTRILKADDTLKVAVGMKTSRAFNHVCNVYGVDKAPEYNKAFAKYSDLVSGLKRKLKFVISLNPYDYLTMSFGNSWTSCHNIKNHGAWCGGTLSYMLDRTSIITYCVGKDDDVQKDNKLYRNMFAWGENMLLQSRVYPQGNDGNTDLYGTFRKLMQNELSEMLELKDKSWIVHTGPTACCNATTSLGVHYKDYKVNSNANISYPYERQADTNINMHLLEIGHIGICAYCGETISDNGRVSHGSCSIREQTTTITVNEIVAELERVITAAEVIDDDWP
jgi:hypothetical protein